MSTNRPEGCDTIVVSKTVDRGMDRLARYEACCDFSFGLLGLTDEVDIWRHLAAHIKYCVDVVSWHIAIPVQREILLGWGSLADGHQGSNQAVRENLPPWLEAQWARWIPRVRRCAQISAQEWQALPVGLTSRPASALCEFPIESSGQRLAMLTVAVPGETPSALDRKLLRHIGAAIAARFRALEAKREARQAELQTFSRQQAEQRADMLAHLVAGLLHEFNSPLAVQMQWTDIVAECVDTLRAQGSEADELTMSLLSEAHAGMGQANRRMVRLLQALKACSGTLTAEAQEAIDLVDWLRAHLDMLRSHPGAPTIVDELGPAPGPQLMLDPQALSTIVRELMDNVNAHANGAPVTVRLEHRTSGVLLHFVDDGQGWGGFDPSQWALPFTTSRRGGVHIGLGGFVVSNIAHDLLGASTHAGTAPSGGVQVTLEWRQDEQHVLH